MSDYERIKQFCLNQKILWEDPDFPANQQSVFYHQTPPFHFEWKRPKEIFSNPTFLAENCNTFDVVPGKLGDQWLVSCLSMLYLHKGLFHRVVPADQGMDFPYAGVFRFRIWWCEQWMEVVVDDRLPTVSGKLAFLHTSHTQQLWPALLEKAYAKLQGSYEALKYGSLLDGLSELTGGISEAMNISEMASFKALQLMLKKTSIITATYMPEHKNEKIPGLEPEVCYRICAADKIELRDRPGVFMLRLRRPEGVSDKKPDNVLVLTADLWESIPQYERQRFIFSPKHQGFWMMHSDFQTVFSRLEMVHLDGETSSVEPTLADKHPWCMAVHQGRWRRGVNAGGCRNFIQYFHMNPQIQLSLLEPDQLIISLHQHSIADPKVIGFSVYKLPAPLSETASETLFKRVKSTIKSHYINSRQVGLRCKLEAAAYLIVPTTFEPREEANFLLRIYSNKPQKIKVLDSPPQHTKVAILKVPPGVLTNSIVQYEAVFLQLADEHKTIDTFELQELLDACLPNDYIKSCASIDTCRQFVLSLDKKGTGRISLSDFKELMCSLKHWQVVFKNHAREKIGVLKAEWLRDALREVGFVVPDEVIALLVQRYMRKDCMLRFGDFVSAVLHLHRAFSLYDESSMKMSLTEWLTNVLKC